MLIKEIKERLKEYTRLCKAIDRGESDFENDMYLSETMKLLKRALDKLEKARK